MRRLLLISVSMMLLAHVGEALAKSPLSQGRAAVLGGWTGVHKAIQGIVIQPIADDGGCLRLHGQRVLIDDHRTIDTQPIDHAHEIDPGRYAVVGVQWQEVWGEDDLSGLSPQEGEYWTVQIAPNVVTNIGVWPVTSPYTHRYVLGDPDPKPALATRAADGVAPLMMATWIKVPVIPTGSNCPPPAAIVH